MFLVRFSRFLLTNRPTLINNQRFLSRNHQLTFLDLFPFCSFIMPKESVSDINRLFKRLKEAGKQASALHEEIKTIRQEIRELSASELFKTVELRWACFGLYLDYGNNLKDTFVFDFSSSSDSENDELDHYEPIPKKTKCDLNFNRDNQGFVVVYTDGACENNGKANAKAGIGVWFGDNHPLNVSEPVKGKATNNTAEIQACISALKTARSQGIDNIKIITDSQFTINCITKWIQNWQRNNWKLAGGRGDVKNKTDLMELDKIRNTFGSVKWEHVAGHQGIHGNEEADKLAREGAMRYKS